MPRIQEQRDPFYPLSSSSCFLESKDDVLTFNMEAVDVLNPQKEVHDIFDPSSNFLPQRGTWGLQGIILLPDRENDFVFFVTIGRVEGHHEFNEGVTTDGVLTW
jgi:hypothetical protein